MAAVAAEEESVPMTDTRTADQPASPDAGVLPTVVDGIDDGTPSGTEAWAALGSLTSRMTSVVRASVSEAARAVSQATALREQLSAPRIVALGDTMTAQGDRLDKDGPGWLALLRARFATRAHVVNYGANEYNALWGSRVLLRALRDESNTNVVLIAFGSSDACNPPATQRLSVEEYRLVLTKMVLHALSVRVAPVLITPPAFDDAQRLEALDDTAEPMRDAQTVAEYAAACRQVATELKLPCVDLHGAMLERAEGAGARKFLADGLHLSCEGNRLLEELVLKVFDSRLKKIAPHALADPLVPWKLIDHENPADSLGMGL